MGAPLYSTDAPDKPYIHNLGRELKTIKEMEDFF